MANMTAYAKPKYHFDSGPMVVTPRAVAKKAPARRRPDIEMEPDPEPSYPEIEEEP